MNKLIWLCYLCLCIPSILCLSEEMQELINSLHSTCVAEIGLDEALIKKANDEKVLPDDPKIKCYIKCILEQTACISEDGVVDVEASIAILPEEIAAKSAPIIRECGAKIGADACESAWLTHKCYMEKSPELYFLI